MNDDRRAMFTTRYQSQNIPWDTGITPPEIVAIVQELAPGRALDLGCGTGTNVRYLLERGWQADGIDFIEEAITSAKQKLAAFPAEHFDVYCHDVTQLEACDGLRAPYDLVIDIGCGHGVPQDKQTKYAHDIAELMAPGASFMLYAHEPTPERSFGWTPADIRRLFTPHLDLVWQELSADTNTGTPSGWYRLMKPSA